MKKLAVLISGTGRNLAAIMQAVADGRIPAKICTVISNRADAAGLIRAEEAGLHTAVIPDSRHRNRDSYDAALAAALDAHDPDIIALAGFMRILGRDFVNRYTGRMLNIHPSLLPAYRGLHTHRRVLEAGDPWHGASVHYVTQELDGGPVVLQGRVEVRSSDSEDQLATRIMRDVEQCIYPIVLSWQAQDRLRLIDNQVAFNGKLLEHPLQLEALETEDVNMAISQRSCGA